MGSGFGHTCFLITPGCVLEGLSVKPCKTVHPAVSGREATVTGMAVGPGMPLIIIVLKQEMKLVGEIKVRDTDGSFLHPSQHHVPDTDIRDK